ncbi:MAG: hypothetical protein ABSF26_27005 [Thermoguttaceae bacterium]|jgi:hypothetical protein
MAGTSSLGRSPAARSVDFDEQMWPINCAILILAGFLVGIVKAGSDFDEPRLLLNGYTHLLGVALLAGGACLIAYRLRGATRRRVQLCLLLSLLVHLSLAVYVYCNPVQLPLLAQGGAGGGGGEEQPDEELVAPDYHWTQVEEPDAPQSFETPVATVVEESAPPSDIQPGDMTRPVPAAEISRPGPAAAMTPLGRGGPGSPLAIRRSGAIAPEQPQPIPTLAMNRQPTGPVELPKLEAEIPQPLPQAPKSPAPQPQTPQVAAEKPQANVGPAGSPTAAAPYRPQVMARIGPQPEQALPAGQAVARAALRPAPGTEAAARLAAAAALSPLPPGGLARSDQGALNLPAGELREQVELAAAAAAGAGGSPGSRIKQTSPVAVTGSPDSAAPQGPQFAAAGSQELGVGSSLIATRSGVFSGRGTARPSLVGFWGDDDLLLRRGAPGSLLDRGAPLPAAAAQRATASQPFNSGSGLRPSLSATLPRTQTAEGIDLPVTALPTGPMASAGAGGRSAGRGGPSGALQPGVAGAGRSMAPGMPGRGNPIGAESAALGARAAAPAAVAASISGETAGPGIIGGPARVGPAGGPGGPEPPAAIARTAANPELSGVVLEAGPGQPAIGPAATTATGQTGGASTGPRTGGPDFAGPVVSGPGPAIGRRTGASATGLGELVGPGDLQSPQPSGIAGRRARQGDQWSQLSLATGPGGIGARQYGGDPGLEGSVREPTDFYRRRAGHHGLSLGEGGGFTEPAIELGLDFFARVQFPDGHWSLDSLPEGLASPSAALGQMRADTAASGLVLLGYLGAGYTHQDEKHRDVVRRGVQWLVKRQKADGDLFVGGSPATRFYSHGIAAMALCEAYGMTQDPELREPAQKAIDYIVSTQDPRRGGWRYEPGQDSDTSVTGWQLLALKSAQMAGLTVPDETFRKIAGWLDRAQGPAKDGRYVYNPWNQDTAEERGGRLPSPAMTAEAMLMRMYLGQRRDNPQLLEGAEFLKANLPQVGTREQPLRNCYYWYYATQAMFEMQGEYWKTWNDQMGPLAKAGQAQDGNWKGSWHPLEPLPDRWGPAAGRIYVTALHLLMLEVYYRHLPLFQELSK